MTALMRCGYFQNGNNHRKWCITLLYKLKKYAKLILIEYRKMLYKKDKKNQCGFKMLCDISQKIKENKMGVDEIYEMGSDSYKIYLKIIFIAVMLDEISFDTDEGDLCCYSFDGFYSMVESGQAKLVDKVPTNDKGEEFDWETHKYDPGFIDLMDLIERRKHKKLNQ